MKDADSKFDQMQPSYGGRGKPLYEDVAAEDVGSKPQSGINGATPNYVANRRRYQEYR